MTSHRAGIAEALVSALVLGVAVGLLVACNGEPTDRRATPASQSIVPRFEELPCAGVLSRELEDARCGYLTVPENRAKPDTSAIRLAVAVLRSTGSAPAPDPLVFITGGPGYPELDGDLDRWLGFDAPLREKRDIVFFDLRGTGRSRPALYCPEVRDELLASLGEPAGVHASAGRRTAALAACRDVLRRSGIDMTGYSSAAVAADLVDLMRALGYREWNLFGLSYGGRIALTVLRDHPEGVRSVVLDSPVPPQVYLPADAPANFQRSLMFVFEACAADTQCDAAYPDLQRIARELVGRLNATPVTVEPVDPATGRATKILVTGDRLIAGTQFVLRDVAGYSFIPSAAYALYQGEYGLLTQAAGSIAYGYGGRADGIAISFSCNEDTPFLDEDVAAAGERGVMPEVVHALRVDVDAELAMCETWGLGEPPTSENEAVVSDIPALLLAGAWDPVTPPSYARFAAETLRRSYVVEFPVTGHAVLYSRTECALSVVSRFMDDPLSQPSESCASQIGPPEFVLP